MVDDGGGFHFNLVSLRRKSILIRYSYRWDSISYQTVKHSDSIKMIEITLGVGNYKDAGTHTHAHNTIHNLRLNIN